MGDLHTTPCDLHEVTNCSICTGVDRRPSLRNLAGTGLPPGSVAAEYPGCGEWIRVGTLIRYSAEASGWVCCDP